MDSESKRVAIYARVSTEMQAEEEIPITGQIEECQRFAASRGWEVVGIYKDEGYTGRNIQRPAFSEMLSVAKQKPRPFDKVVTWKGSRIARNVQDRLACQALLQKQGIAIVSPNEPEFEGATKVLMVPIMAAIDEYQSYLIGEDTLRGLKTLARQGYSAGGRPPRGYRTVREVVGLKKNGEPRFRTKWEPDPEWKDKALKAFQMLAEGRSSDEIMRETGVIKDKSGMSTYFRNPTFIGERVFNVHRRKGGRIVKFALDDPEVIRVPNAHEAIVPRELFDRVQAILDKRRPQPGQIRARKHDFILSGVLWCARHDCPMTGFGNKERRYYACESYRRGGRKESDCRLLKKEPLENFVVDIVKRKIFTHKRVKEALTELNEVRRGEGRQMLVEVSQLRKEIRQVERELENFYKAIGEGIPARNLAKPIEERTNRKAELEKELDNIRRKKPEILQEIAIDDEAIEAIRGRSLELLDSEDPATKRVFVRTYIEKIKVTGDSITIYFSFKEPPASSQEMVAGVGFEPTTSGL